MLKKGIIPKWARSWLGGLGGLEAWVLEESEVSWLVVMLLGKTRGMKPAKCCRVIMLIILSLFLAFFSQVTFQGSTPRLTSTTRNISHKKIMSVIEGTELVSAGGDR
jgi:hypothetical protein